MRARNSTLRLHAMYAYVYVYAYANLYTRAYAWCTVKLRLCVYVCVCVPLPPPRMHIQASNVHSCVGLSGTAGLILILQALNAHSCVGVQPLPQPRVHIRASNVHSWVGLRGTAATNNAHSSFECAFLTGFACHCRNQECTFKRECAFLCVFAWNCHAKLLFQNFKEGNNVRQTVGGRFPLLP